MSTLRNFTLLALPATLALGGCSYASPGPAPVAPVSPLVTSSMELSQAPVASLSDSEDGKNWVFLVTLDGSGIKYDDPVAATEMGWQVCSMLKDGWLPEKIVGVGLNGYEPREASTIITAAVGAICPELSYKLN